VTAVCWRTTGTAQIAAILHGKQNIPLTFKYLKIA
jgi:hypothetical protein